MRPREVKISQAVRHPIIKANYNPKISPARNLEKLGFEANANNLLCSKDDSNPDPKFKAFVGFAEMDDDSNVGRKKQLKLDDLQLQYAKNCIEKFGDDYVAMSRDIVVNFNQMTVAKLRKLCGIYLNQSSDE